MKKYTLKFTGSYWMVTIGNQTFQVGPDLYDYPKEELAAMIAFYKKAITTALDNLSGDA